jgi:hypothetical protein
MNKEEPIDNGEELPIVDSPLSMEERVASAETTAIVASEPLTTYHLQPKTPMEVHHHPHVEKKSFKEYLLEGLMIFIAVSMGFIAENIREGIVHREKEKQQIESFVNALENDSVQLVNVTKMNDTIINLISHFTELRKRKVLDASFKKDFYNYSYALCLDSYFKPNVAALEEMKSSGIIGGLHKRSIADSIFKYQQNNNIIEMQAADCYYLFKEINSLLQNTIDMNNYFDPDNTTFKMGEDNIPYVKFKDYNQLEMPEDKKALKNIYSHAANLIAANFAYITMLKGQLVYNRQLANFLKKEYHLAKK